MPGGYFVHNGQLFREGKAVISPDNRSFRYGDGLFETLRVRNGAIVLKEFHFERLQKGMGLLRFDIPDFFTLGQMEADIMALCKKNRIEEEAIVRMVVFRSDGGLYDLDNMRPNYIIQSMMMPQTKPSSEGLIVDVYADATKSCNIFSEVKSNNFLPYVMGVLYAKQQGLADALILNQYGRIAESTIANIFWVEGGVIYTPPLTEGCVAGVARRFLLSHLPQQGYKVKEHPLDIDRLLAADEAFLTNVIRGIRPILKFRNREFTVTVATALQQFWNSVA